MHDLVGVALDWTGPDPVAFGAAIDAYRTVADLSVPAQPWVFGGWLAAQGGWLDFTATTRAGTATGDAEVAATLDRMSRLAKHLDVLVDALR